MTIEEMAYLKHKHLGHAAAELGLKWQTLYSRLRNQGVKVTGDKSRYGSDKDRLAARAEMEFKRIVPFAEDQNAQAFQSKFDFLVGKEKVDVKSAMLRQGSKRFDSLRWAFSVKKQEFCADFIACFGMLDDGYKLFLIPGEFVRKYQTISISQAGQSKWKQFEIDPSELADFFRSIAF